MRQCRRCRSLVTLASDPVAVAIAAPEVRKKVDQQTESQPQPVLADDAPRKKPAPDALFLCADLLGTPAAACVYIGDTCIDVRAAKAAGMRCVAVAQTFPAERLQEADVVRESVADVELADLTQDIA